MTSAPPRASTSTTRTCTAIPRTRKRRSWWKGPREKCGRIEVGPKPHDSIREFDRRRLERADALRVAFALQIMQCRSRPEQQLEDIDVRPGEVCYGTVPGPDPKPSSRPGRRLEGSAESSSQARGARRTSARRGDRVLRR